MRAQSITRTSWEIYFLYNGLYSSSKVESNEAFSKEELLGNEFTSFKPIIQLEADLSQNEYYHNKVYPLVYESYPIDGDIRITKRKLDSLGVVPVKAVRLRQYGDELVLRQADILAGSYSFLNPHIRFQYMLTPFMYLDYKEIQAKVASRYVGKTHSERISRLLVDQFKLQSSGRYDILAKYYLPGRSQPNSEVLIPTYLEIE
jgi:hypothetical protein